MEPNKIQDNILLGNKRNTNHNEIDSNLNNNEQKTMKEQNKGNYQSIKLTVEDEEKLNEMIEKILTKDYSQQKDKGGMIKHDFENLFLKFYKCYKNTKAKVTVCNWRKDENAKRFILELNEKYKPVINKLLNKYNIKPHKLIRNETTLEEKINQLMDKSYKTFKDKRVAIRQDFEQLFISFYNSSINPEFKVNVTNYYKDNKANRFISELKEKYKPVIDTVLNKYNINPHKLIRNETTLEEKINQLMDKNYTNDPNKSVVIHSDFIRLFICYYNGSTNPEFKVNSHNWRKDENANRFISELKEKYKPVIDTVLNKYNINPYKLIRNETTLDEEISKIMNKDYTGKKNKVSSIFADFEQLFVYFYNGSKNPEFKLNSNNWRTDNNAKKFVDELQKKYKYKIQILKDKWRDNNANNKSNNELEE